MTTQPQSVPDRYEIRRTLGEGGMGQVLVAWDREMEREVALKVVSKPPSEKIRARFAREGRLLAGLRCAQVVEVYDLDATATLPWMTMELLVGNDLASLRLADPVATYLEVARGLAAVHDAGVVHRDVKPANVLRTQDGRIVLIDFGLATGAGETKLTQTGDLLGSFAYLAPEVLLGERATVASDWYSWGVCLYRALEGGVPFDQEELVALLTGEVRPMLRFETLPAGSPERRLLQACLRQDPARRPTGLADIEALLTSRGSGGAGARGTKVARSQGIPPERVAASARELAAAKAQGRGRRRVLPWAGGLALALVGLLWSRGPTAESPLPSSHAATAPATSQGASGLPDPVGVALEAELLDALDAPGSETDGFRRAYADQGAGAYEGLPGQAAWLAWIRAGGDPQRLQAEVRQRLARVDSAARAMGLVAPFGEGWFLEDGPLEPAAWAERARAEASALRRELAVLESQVRAAPERFPGYDPAARMLDGRARLLAIFGTAASAPRQRRELDEILARYRARWRRTLGAAARALDGLPPGAARGLLRALGNPSTLRVGVFGSLTGADPVRVQGYACRGLAARKYTLWAWDVTGRMSRRHDFPGSVRAAEREAAWVALAGAPGPDAPWVVELRHHARVSALHCARERNDVSAGRRILATIEEAGRVGPSADMTRRLEESEAWLAGHASGFSTGEEQTGSAQEGVR
jgi:hypothetical protein